MKKLLLTASVVLAQMLGVSAFAQTKGEADPAQSRAVPSAPATAAEKATAKTTRKAEGTAAAKTDAPGGIGPEPGGMAKTASKEDRLAAAKTRKAGAAAAVKKGEIPAGEK
jgi:hypothetical protein